MPMKRTATFYSLNTKVNADSPENRKMSNANGPSKSVIRNILNYSKALAVLQTKDAGMINLVLN